MNHQNQSDDDLWKEAATRYCDENGVEYARGTPRELAEQVRKLKAELAETVDFANDVILLIKTGWGHHTIGKAILFRIDSMLRSDRSPPTPT